MPKKTKNFCSSTARFLRLGRADTKMVFFFLDSENTTRTSREAPKGAGQKIHGIEISRKRPILNRKTNTGEVSGNREDRDDQMSRHKKYRCRRSATPVSKSGAAKQESAQSAVPASKNENDVKQILCLPTNLRGPGRRPGLKCCACEAK